MRPGHWSLHLVLLGLAIAVGAAAAPQASADNGGTQAYSSVLVQTALDDTRVPFALSWQAQSVQETGYGALATYSAAAAAVEQARAEAAQREALAGFFRAVAAHAAAPPASGGGSAAGSSGGDPNAFLTCTRWIESRGDYGAVSPGGTYRGAYQFDRTTWNSTAGSSGRSDLVGVDPASASSTSQDQMARALYASRGNQPWGGRC